MATDKRYLTGIFPDRESAELAYQGVLDRGYDKDDVNLVMSKETRERHFSNEHGETTELGNKAAEGAGIGAGLGGVIGAVGAAIAAVGTSIAIPGLGLVIAGPIAAALAGAGAGGCLACKGDWAEVSRVPASATASAILSIIPPAATARTSSHCHRDRRRSAAHEWLHGPLVCAFAPQHQRL